MTTAILFLTYNRFSEASQVFESIREYKPTRLYFSSNAPNPKKPLDSLEVEKVRNLISQIDWDCDVRYLFRKEHLLVGESIPSAIDWFFETEEQGIILEDDVLPCQDFFKFCELMLEKYKFNQSVMMVGGYNPFGSQHASGEYFFSENPSVWGWATWKNRWDLYSIDIKYWPNSTFMNFLKSKFPKIAANYFIGIFNSSVSKLTNTWDYQWLYCILTNRGVTIKPAANLICNIGAVGEHSVAADRNHFRPHGKICWENFSGPALVIPDVIEDQLFFNEIVKRQSQKNKIYRILNKLGIYSYLKQIYVFWKK
jgi:hypothetical protein